MLPRNGFLGMALMLTCAHFAHATDAITTPPPGATLSPSDPSSPQSFGLLVLKGSGRVITGNIQPRPSGGYDVETPLARLFIAKENVWIQARDITEAHEKMRDSLPRHTPDSHLELARWCVRQQLYGSARRELLDALHLDPYREDARDMLAAVMKTQAAASKSAIRRTTTESIKDKIQNAMAGYTPDRNVVGGLSADHARQFSRSVQPLMVRKCASCHHGRSDRAFTLMSTRQQVTPASTEHNLSQLLNQMDFEHPVSSPLLKIGGVAHGGMQQDPLTGRTEQRQWAAFAEWVTAVAAANGPGPYPTHPQPEAVIQQTAAISSADTDAAFSAENSANFHPADEKLLQDAARRNRQDAFNPDVFNRKFRSPESAETP